MSEPITKRFNFREFFGQAFASAVSPNAAPSPAASSGGCGKGGSCGCGSTPKPPASLVPHPSPAPSGGCGNGGSCGCGNTPKPAPSPAPDRGLNRRQAIQAAVTGIAAAGTTGCSTSDDPESKEEKALKWEEYFKKNYRVMTRKEQLESIDRLEKLAKINHGRDVEIQGTQAQEGVLYGYAFNVSKCEGYRKCVDACIQENNLDRKAETQYIRIFEMENGSLDIGGGNAEYVHEVPAEGHFYLGTQCFQCANPPCVEVCPVGATWQEPDGIVVIDYDWCIGCRYCQAACPYWARRFNWAEPEVPAEEINPNQHYLGNRPRKKGCMEKCTFCIQRTRNGQLPACAEACPTGARVFGNLLDPDSELRYVLENKKVFRLKEDLGTEPKFWYFMD